MSTAAAASGAMCAGDIFLIFSTRAFWASVWVGMVAIMRVHAKGELPEEYQPNLGKGFDAKCCAFLPLDYAEVARRVKEGASDEEMLEWALTTGRRPSEAEIDMWNEFMRKFGWRDHAAEILERRKREGGMADCADIETMFQFIDADEGRATAVR